MPSLVCGGGGEEMASSCNPLATFRLPDLPTSSFTQKPPPPPDALAFPPPLAPLPRLICCNNLSKSCRIYPAPQQHRL